MITLESCSVCGSYQIAEHRIISGGHLIIEIMPGVKVKGDIITRYSTCHDCKLIFQNPRLSDAELDIYYSSGYYRRRINPPPEGMDKGEENRAEIDSKIIREHVGEVESHLDIGCGRGYLLHTVDAKVKVGVESDINYVKVKGVKVYPETDNVPSKEFDLVTAIHVLEHVPYPLDFLKKIAKFVGKNGHIVVEVPSWKTRGGPLGFAHLSYFEPDVLKLMCMRVGLTVTQTELTPHLLLICQKETKSVS